MNRRTAVLAAIVIFGGVAGGIGLLGLGGSDDPSAESGDAVVETSTAARDAPALVDAVAKDDEATAESAVAREIVPAADVASDGPGEPADIVVRVLDASGTPRPGLDVRAGSPDDAIGSGLAATTGPDGIARFAGAYLGRDRHEGAPSLWRISVKLPFSTPCQLVADHLELTRSIHDITLPPTGRVEVSLRRNGAPYRGYAVAKLFTRAEGAREFALWESRWTSEGLVTFESVEAKVEAKVEVDIENTTVGSDSPSRTITVDGPNRFVIDVPAIPRLTFRLLSPDGPVLAWQPFTLVRHGVPKASREEPLSVLTTDEEGKAVVAWPDPRVSGEPPGLEIVVVSRLQEIGTVLVDVAPFLGVGGGDRDLGDLRLTGTRLVVSGKVVDDLGAPVPGVSVRATMVRDTVVNSDATGVLGGNGFVATTSGTDGGFEIRSSRLAGTLSLTTFGRGHMHARATCESGVRDLVLRVTRAGRMQIVLRPREPDFARRIVVSLIPIEDDTKGGETLESAIYSLQSPQPTVTYVSSDLAPGRYDVSIQIAPLGEVMRIANVIVPPGGVAQDERLNGVFLDLPIREIVVTVVDERGDPIRGATVRSHSEHGSAVESTSERGRAVVPVLLTGSDLYVEASGRRAEVRENVQRDLTMTLLPGIEVELHVTSAVSTDGLFVHLRDADESDRSRIDAIRVVRRSQVEYLIPDRNSFDAGGIARLKVSAPGKYSIDWTRVRNLDGLALGTTEIEIADVAYRQTFEVTPPPER